MGSPSGSSGGNLAGVAWGTRTVGIDVRCSADERRGEKEWDVEKKGVQVDGRW